MTQLESSNAQVAAGMLVGQQAKTELFQKVERFFVQYMEQNNDRMPSVAKVRDGIGGGSNRDLCPVVREVRHKLESLQTRLGAMSRIPEDLVRAHEQMLKEIWAKTCELQTVEIADLKRAQQARDALHDQEIQELYAIISTLELEGEVLLARAEAAEARLRADAQTLHAMTEALATAQARLAEREEIMAMLAAAKPAAQEPATRKAGRAGRSVVEEGDLLPGFSVPVAEATDPGEPE